MKRFFRSNIISGTVIFIIGWLLFACNQDKTAPEINILGLNPHNVCINDTYVDAGATASDNEDGDLTSKINTVINVDTADTGTYSVTYTVEDDAGNSTSKERIVKVIFCK